MSRTVSEVVSGGRRRLDGLRRPSSRARAYVLMVGVVLALGLNWPLINMGLDSVSPWWFVVMRMGGAAAAIWVYNTFTRRVRPVNRADLPVVISVALGRLTIMTGMVFVALQFVDAGRSAVLVWTASLWTVPIAAVAIKEHMTPVRWVGLAVGIIGIVALVEPWEQDWSEGGVVFGHALLLVAAVLHAAVSVHIRGHRWRSSPRELLPWQFLAATPPLILLAFSIEGAPRIDWSVGFGANIFYQAVIASAFALWAQQTVLQRLSATSMSLTLMAVPVVGLLSSVIVLDERLTVMAVLGVLAIIAGVATNIVADSRTAEGRVQL